MVRLAEVLSGMCARGQRGEAVRRICRTSQGVAQKAKERILQELLEEAVIGALGPPRGQRPKELTPWSCRSCGARRGDQLRRNGHYRRRILVREGPVELQMPQLLCVDCGKSVAVELPLLAKRQRLWMDLDQQVASTYLEGCSYRAVRRLLERDSGASIGLMTIWRRFQAVGKGPHAVPERPPARYLGFDEVYQKVKGEKRWLLCARAEDIKGGKHWVGFAVSEERTEEAWSSALSELGISRYRPTFTVITDGDAAIESAVATTLPGVRTQRCTWHLKHNAAEWIRERYPKEEDEGQRKGLMAAVHVIVDAPTESQRRESLAVLRADFGWLVERLQRVLERIPPKDSEHPVRTNNLCERGFREERRRTRPMDGFGSDKGLANFHLLWMLKENARLNNRDYLVELIP